MEYKFNVAKQNNDNNKFNAEQALKEKQQQERNAIEKEKLAAQKEKERRIASGVGRSSGGGGRRGGSGGGGRSSSGSKITFRSNSGRKYTISGVNKATIRRIFDTLPKNVQRNAKGFGFGEPDDIEMIRAIESQIDKDQKLRELLSSY